MSAAMSAIDTALLALNLGLSPVPPMEDGTKRPFADIPDGVHEDGRPKFTWKPYSVKPATVDRVRSWFTNGRKSIGLATGYNGLECFEFDCRQTYEDFLEAATELGYGDLVDRIRTGYEEFTPGDGVHWLYYCDETRGNTKLAERPNPADPNKRDPLIETRGDGGFIIIAPSNGTVHPSGGAYKLVNGRLASISTLQGFERDELWNLARTFDEMAKAPEADPDHDPWIMTVPGDRSAFPKQGKRPGDDFAERTPWESIVESHQWAKVFTRGDDVYWRRPGKDRGVSATTGHCKGLKVFTTSTSLKTDGTYTKLGAYAALNHGGDFKAAVRKLAESGYGTWIDDDGKERQNPVPKEWFEKRKAKQSQGQPAGPATPVSEAEIDWDAVSDEDMGILSGDKIDPKPVEWLWPSRIAKKKMNVVAGEGKQGKTQMVLAIAAATSVGGEWPDGSGRAEKGTVIILSAEDDPEDTLAPRLIALGANMSKIKIIKSDYIIRRKGKEPAINPIDFQRTPYWRALLRRFPDLQLFIADPVPSFLGRGVNDHKNAEIRSILTPFLDVVRDFNVAMIAITHLSKAVDPKRPASNRIIGSIAYANLARSIHFVAKSPDDPAKRLFMMAENTSAANDLPAVVFELEPRQVTTNGGQVFDIWVPRFEIDTVQVDVNEVVNSDVKQRGRPPTKAANELAKWVLDYLRKAGAPVRKGDVYNAAGDADLIGEYGPDSDGKLRWSKGYLLSRACARIAKLEGPDAGWMIDELEEGGRKYLQVIATLHNHVESKTQDAPF
jgi:AAA domain/Bifunctional DNA primase/polymerase, N-terminal